MNSKCMYVDCGHVVYGSVYVHVNVYCVHMGEQVPVPMCVHVCGGKMSMFTS